MQVVVTGASGFIGSHLVDSLLDQGHKVRAVARRLPGLISISALSNPRLSLHSVDIKNRLDLESVIAGSELVVHLASGSLPQSSNHNPSDDIAVNLLGTINLLEASRFSNVKRVVVVSSGGTVYGLPKSLPIKEDHPTDPICSYGITKLAIEKYIYLYRALYGLDGLVLRVANPYGPRQRLDSNQGVIPVFLGRVMRNENVEIWGSGEVVRDFIYISDLISAITLACSYTGSEYLFNIGSGQGLSLQDLLLKFELLFNKSINVIYKESRGFDVPVNVLSIDRAISKLGWRPAVSIDKGLNLFYESLNNINV